MDMIIKAIAGILIASVLYQTVSKQGNDVSLLLIIVVCCMVVSEALTYFRPIISFIDKLQNIGQLNEEMIGILMKAVGIGILTEVTSLICADMGNAALGKSLQILAIATILWISLPLFNKLLDLIETVLGAA